MIDERYSRQTLLPEIGTRGQKRLARGRAVVIGCGALGTHVLSFLVRAGVGKITLIDRDIVDLSNLQRQTLFSEKDVGRPKAKVAEEYLRNINSDVKITAVITDLNHVNIEDLIEGADVVLDATDNMDTRFLVNDACVKHDIPWIYAGAVGTTGMVLPIMPGGPCLRCVFQSPPQPGELPTCDTVGIVNTLPAAVASIEATEGFKIVLGKEASRELAVIDIWSGELQRIKVKRNPNCPCCGRKDFEFLNARKRKFAVSMCGRNAVQIVPSRARKGDLEGLARKLSRSGKAVLVDGVLRFEAKGVDMTVFPDGRTIVAGTSDLSAAKTLFSKYVGD